MKNWKCYSCTFACVALSPSNVGLQKYTHADGKKHLTCPICIQKFEQDATTSAPQDEERFSSLTKREMLSVLRGFKNEGRSYTSNDTKATLIEGMIARTIYMQSFEKATQDAQANAGFSETHAFEEYDPRQDETPSAPQSRDELEFEITHVYANRESADRDERFKDEIFLGTYRGASVRAAILAAAKDWKLPHQLLQVRAPQLAQADYTNYGDGGMYSFQMRRMNGSAYYQTFNADLAHVRYAIKKTKQVRSAYANVACCRVYQDTRYGRIERKDLSCSFE